MHITSTKASHMYALCRELKPHRLVEATAYKNRMFLMALTANGRQWRKGQEKLRKIQVSRHAGITRTFFSLQWCSRKWS